MCSRWSKFENFYADMGERPEGSTLDRIDNEKGYSPENCRWATRVQQSRNTRVSVEVEFRGRTQCLAAWSEELGIAYATLYQRVVIHGWDVERALTTPVRIQRKRKRETVVPGQSRLERLYGRKKAG